MSDTHEYATPPASKRCAVYTRVSVDDGNDDEIGSADVQFMACHELIASQRGNGWKPFDRLYEDKGVSGYLAWPIWCSRANGCWCLRPKLRPLGDEKRKMSPDTPRSRLAKGDLQHPPRKFVLAAWSDLGCVEISICSAVP
jgi:hypothetical protein